MYYMEGEFDENPKGSKKLDVGVQLRTQIHRRTLLYYCTNKE